MKAGIRVKLLTSWYGYTHVYIVKWDLLNCIVRADNGHTFEVPLNEIITDCESVESNPAPMGAEPGFKNQNNERI